MSLLQTFTSIFFIAILPIFLLSCTAQEKQATKTETDETNLSFLELPKGFAISIFADNLGGSWLARPGPEPGPRFMAVREDVLYVSVPNHGHILALPDYDDDGKADEIITVISELNRPHGIEFYGGWMYVANEDPVIRVRMSNLTALPETKEVLIKEIQMGGH